MTGSVLFLVILSVCIAGCGSNVPQPIPKNNLTTIQEKLSSDLLRLAENQNQSGQGTSTGSVPVYVYIKIKENTDPNALNPFVQNITDRDPVNRIYVAWVDPKKLMDLASLDEVQSIQTVVPPSNQGRMG